MSYVNMPDSIQTLFRSPSSLLLVVEHTLIVYACLVIGFRLVGRRQLGQLTLVDLIILILMGSAVETAMVGGRAGQPNTSLSAGVVAAGTLFAANRLLTLSLLRVKRLRRLIIGEPVLLVNHGHLVQEHLKREGLTEADVLEAIRERGEESLENVRFAVLEVDGSIHVVENPPGPHPAVRPL